MYCFVLGAAAALFLSTPSSVLAQSNSLTATPSVMTSIDHGTITTMLTEKGIIAAAAPQSNGHWLVEASIPGGNTFYMILRECSNAAMGSGCSVMETFAIMQSSNITLETINKFHISASRTATVIQSAANSGIIYNKTFLSGGITRDNLLFQIGLLLLDADTFHESISTNVVEAKLTTYPDIMGRGVETAALPPHLAGIVAQALAQSPTEDRPTETRPFLKGDLSAFVHTRLDK